MLSEEELLEIMVKNIYGWALEEQRENLLDPNQVPLSQRIDEHAQTLSENLLEFINKDKGITNE